jgi:hypothetical protein
MYVIIPGQGEFGKWHPGWGRKPLTFFYGVGFKPSSIFSHHTFNQSTEYGSNTSQPDHFAWRKNTCTVGESSLKSWEGDQYYSARPFCMEKNKMQSRVEWFKKNFTWKQYLSARPFCMKETTSIVGQSVINTWVWEQYLSNRTLCMEITHTCIEEGIYFKTLKGLM